MQAERRLGIGPWLVPPNENNELLRKGAAALGHSAAATHAMCEAAGTLVPVAWVPHNAKQSMLVTGVPTALANGARLLPDTVQTGW